MKKTILLILSLVSLNFLTGCGGGDNAYDGKTGLLSANTNALVSIQENILKSNAQTLNNQVKEVQDKLIAFNTNLTATDVQALQNDFVEMVSIWKRVEALYVANEYDSSMRTMPINIDFFNKGKNLDVATNIDAALGLAGALQANQLKNSSKTITGLEYMLFGNQETLANMVTLMNQNNKKRIDAIKFAIAKIYANTTLIDNFYKNNVKFQEDQTETLNILVNTLVQSSFDLRELRIGEAAGYIVKTKDDPKAERLEYYRSKKSLEAIKAILLAHQQIMGEQSYDNFGSFASSNGADAIIIKIRANLTTSLAIVNQFSNPIQNSITPALVDTKVKNLYDEITDLQKNYFESLINALNLTADIIEADGD